MEIFVLKWNESGFRPHLCTYRLNWARRTSWGWWDDWDYTVLQTQDSKIELWRSEAEHATSRSRRLPTILTVFHTWMGKKHFLFLSNRRTPNSGVKGSGANHYPRAPALFVLKSCRKIKCAFRDVKRCFNASWGLKGFPADHDYTRFQSVLLAG